MRGRISGFEELVVREIGRKTRRKIGRWNR